ncbi:MAG: 4'-phosphopantetheinyl transferase superfamily protein [Thermoguttaceae bacterium]|nr:4'-phosphopantetheinyl transferase superfamily protein [Thermoguttaceae bacterium]
MGLCIIYPTTGIDPDSTGGLRTPARLPDDIYNLEEYLSLAESEYIHHVRHPQVRQNWGVSRVLVKRLTENVLAQSQSGEFVYSDYTVISKNENNKGCQPFVLDKNGERLPYWYTISHVDGFVAAGIDCYNPLGVDLCKVGAVAAVVERGFYTEREKNALADAAPEFRPVLSSLIWTAKEAAYKLLSIQTLEPFVPARYELASDVTEIALAQTVPFDPFGLTLDFPASQFSKEKVVYTGKENSLCATVQFCRYEDVVVALAIS